MTVVQNKEKEMDPNSEISDSNLNFFYYPVRDWRVKRLRNILEDNKVKT